MRSSPQVLTVVGARSLRLHGAPQSALDNLRPLVGKVIDDSDREIFLEELALTAIAAHDDYEALAYLDAWEPHLSRLSTPEASELNVNALLKQANRVLGSIYLID